MSMQTFLHSSTRNQVVKSDRPPPHPECLALCRLPPGGQSVVAILCILLAVWGMRSRTPVEESYRETLYVFGTLVEIVIYGEERETARHAVAEIERDFRRIHKDWHAWHPGELAGLNDALSRGEAFTVSDSLADLLRNSKTLGEKSGGLFEPAVGGIIDAWGFNKDEPPSGAPPSDDLIAQLARQSPRMADVTIDGNSVHSSNRAVVIDLGGVAKGAALDLAAERLRKLGIRNAVLNAGGNVYVLGRHGKRPWRVAIRDPFIWGVIASLDLSSGEVLSTSGNYERFFEHNGERFSHIIDPRTGRPVRDIVSVSVLHTNGAAADAASTALSVAGPEHWQDTARSMGLDLALLIDKDGTIFMTPAMRNRITLMHPDQSMIHVMDPTKAIASSSQ